MNETQQAITAYGNLYHAGPENGREISIPVFAWQIMPRPIVMLLTLVFRWAFFKLIVPSARCARTYGQIVEACTAWPPPALMQQNIRGLWKNKGVRFMIEFYRPIGDIVPTLQFLSGVIGERMTHVRVSQQQNRARVTQHGFTRGRGLHTLGRRFYGWATRQLFDCNDSERRYIIVLFCDVDVFDRKKALRRIATRIGLSTAREVVLPVSTTYPKGKRQENPTVTPTILDEFGGGRNLTTQLRARLAQPQERIGLHRHFEADINKT